MNEGANKPSVEAPKQETQKLEMTSQPIIESQPKEEKGSLSSQVEVLLSSTEYASRQSEFLEKLNAFSGQEDLIIGLMQQALTYNRQDVLEDVLKLDEFGDELPVQIGTIRDKITPAINNQEKESEKFVSDYIKNNVQDFFQNEFGVRYKEDMDFITELPKNLSESQIQKLQDLLNDIKNNQTDSVRSNGLGTIEKQLEEYLKNREVKEENTEVKEENTELTETEKKTEKILVATEKIRGDLEGKKIVEDKILSFKTSDKIDEDIQKLSISENEKQIVQILSEIIKTNNTQAIEDILMVAAQADPKGVEGETFKAFYEVFETSGVDKTQLDAMRERIIRSENKEALLQTSSSSDLFPGAKNVSGEVRLDEKGNFIFENQKLDIGEKPPGLYLVGKDNFEIKTKDRGYYKELVEKNKKDTELKQVKQELQDIKNTSQELTHENENLEKLRAEKLEQFGLLSDTEDPLYKSYKKEIDDLEQKIETNKSTLEENKKKEIALEQQIATLKGDISILVESLTQKKDSLNTQKEKTQDTVNFLDNIGFTHIQKDDIDWIVTQVNSFDATYYGFSQPLNFENGFDYQTNKGYQEFMKFFDTLIYGKNPKDMKKGVTGTDQNTFIDGRDKSRSNVSFRNDLITQGVLREDGRLNQFNFFQKFSSRNTEKQPTVNAPKEGSEAKQ